MQERADQIAEWAELTAQKEILLAQVAPKAPHRPEGGERQSARDLGLDRNEVQRAKKIASITPEAKQAARDAGIDGNRLTSDTLSPIARYALRCASLIELSRK